MKRTPFIWICLNCKDNSFLSFIIQFFKISVIIQLACAFFFPLFFEPPSFQPAIMQSSCNLSGLLDHEVKVMS